MNLRTKLWWGIAAWTAFVVPRVGDLQAEAWSQALLLFAALVLLPLALDLFRDDTESAEAARGFDRVGALQTPAALLLAGAGWLSPGPLALAAALPWGVLTGLLASIGFMRLSRGGLRRPLDGLCRDAALIYAAVGGAWTLADRGGLRPLGFDSSIVALTAVHFHYAGLLLPLFAGLVQRELWFWRFASRAAVGVVLGVPAVAIGTATTQLCWGTSLETAAGVGLALAGMAVAILHVRIATEGRHAAATRILLAITGASLFFGMLLAALYAMRTSAMLVPGLGIPQMRMLHGTVNAIGFGLCGVLAWRSVRRSSDVVAPG